MVVGGQGGPRGASLRWGLVPSWASDPAIGNRLINARSETAHRKPAFREAFRGGRCLVPADGFFEWKKTPHGRLPVWVHAEGEGLLTLAGLSDRWESPEGEVLESFTILTTDASDLLRPVHDRMPVVLRPEARAAWLDPATPPDEARALLGPLEEGLALREVSRRVNSPEHDDPECLGPPDPPGADLPLFRDAE